MEENETLDSSSLASSSVNALSNQDKEYLSLAAYWAKFLGIIGFISTGFLVLLSLFMILNLSAELFNNLGGAFASFGSVIGIIYLGMAALSFYISLYSYNFGIKTKFALQNNSDESLTESFKNLKSLFRTYGILTAIILGSYAIIIVFAIFASAFVLLK